MNIGHIYNELNNTISNGEVSDLGRKLFGETVDAKELCALFGKMLESKMYEKLACVVCCGFINKSYNEKDYVSNEVKTKNLNDRYFDLFMEISNGGGIGIEKIMPMLFYAFKSNKKSDLYSWRFAIEVYFYKLALSDYDKMASFMDKYDADYSLYQCLIRVDRQRTIDGLVKKLLFSKNINKVKIRKFLKAYSGEIVYSLQPIYYSGDYALREGIVRLLLLFKNEPRAAALLLDIKEREKSIVIKRLIDKDAGLAKKSEENIGEQLKISNGKVKVNIDKKTYEIDMNDKFELSITGDYADSLVSKLEVKLEEVKVIIDRRLDYFVECMVEGTRFTVSEFNHKILKDSLNAMIAATLFFSIYNGSDLVDIVIVDKGKILDLSNQPKELDSNFTVKVLHPIDLGFKYQYLKQVNIFQPIVQLHREVFSPTAEDTDFNYCRRFNGSIINADCLKRGFKEYKFKPMGKDEIGKYTMAGRISGEVLGVIEFTKSDLSGSQTVTLGNLKFYSYTNVVKLNGQLYVDGVPLLSIKEIDERIYSEFLYMINTILRCQ